MDKHNETAKGQKKHGSKPLMLLPILVTMALLNGCDSGPEASCQKTTRNFINRFNSQDFRGIASLFKPGALNKQQITSMSNNLTYLFRAAGGIKHMRFSNQQANRISYISIHEKTSMELIFQMDDQCNLLSYKIDTHFPDSLPQLERNTTSLSLPVQGEWYVKWGGPGVAQNYHNAHRNMKGAIDFIRRDQDGKSYRSDGKKNEDYYAYGQPVISPCDARVVKVVKGIEDNPVGRASAAKTYGNAIVLQTDEEEYLLLAHLQSGSIEVQEGQMVNQGHLLARCGNSWYSSEPHLHFIVQNVADFFHPTGASCYFDSIAVNGVLMQDYSPVQGDVVRNY
jgi:murein DD-endopeptidase MepM/ murein hydrolase activator NlpD